MERRHFVWLASAGAVAASIPAVNYFYGIPKYDKKLSTPQQLALIWEEKEILEIGAKYREKFQDESSERTLARMLFSDAENQSHKKLEEITQADFANGRTVTVDGWVLAITEARQCALFHSLTQKV